MKKLKTICSAIVALSVLALAGCDLEIPDKSYVYYGTTVTVMQGTARGNYGATLTGYACPMVGTWVITSYIDGEEKASKEEKTGAGWWVAGWDGNKATEQSVADGSTLKIVAEAQTDGEIFFEAYGNGCYVSLNPSKDEWGAGTTYIGKEDSPKTFIAGEVVTFTVNFEAGDEEGNAYYKIVATGGEEDD